MVSFAGLERLPLAGVATPGHFGRADASGLTIVVRGDVAFASLNAKRDERAALVAAVETAFGLTLPDGPRRVTVGALTFAGTGPTQWMASAEGTEAEGFTARLRARLGPFAAVTDQSDARLVLQLSGADVRDVLAKGVPIDLHPKVFKVGDVAVTQAAYIGMQIDRLDEATYQLATARSTAGSFWSWLSASAAEFGYDVVTR
jgi:methylglutamate dehydrogenase subunit D